ncbi:hypothetical protein G7Y89_g9148 [Cudoniella acicularis]|uniref:ARM repeat-containing protein n=1 Tax=Cudoniella acicularis TaxID=354080 RepID=A0A8H4RHV7_9HELO|nr:hypothetical protein G7Y89_g9148 [Cudoniella acicularis]
MADEASNYFKSPPSSGFGGTIASTQTAPLDPLDLLTSKSNSPVPALPGDYFDPASLNLDLSNEEQSKMAKSIREIFQLEEEPEDEDQAMGEGDEEPEIDQDDQRRRTERLSNALINLNQLWWSGYEHMDLVTECLADGSRDPRWRIPLGDSGILNLFLEVMSTNSLIQPLKIQVLRLIGNSCADTGKSCSSEELFVVLTMADENRARLVASNFMPSIILQLQDAALIPFAIPVLYNICVDYEPAQQQASNLFLSKQLIDLISSPLFNNSRAFLGYTCKILDFLITQHLAPENTPIVLLKIAADREFPCDMEDFVSLINTAVAYMQHEKFQKALISHGGLDTTLVVLVDSYTRFDSHPSIGSSAPDQDDAKILSQMRTNLNQVLSDVSALPEFKKAYPVVSSFTSSLRRWLSSPQLQLQVCACIMLGNLARSDEACEEFVHTSRVHKPLITILTDANDSQLLHSALGFMKNLALPAKNKEVIGNSGLFEVLPRLWLLDTLQQIQFSSISLARQLVNGTFENVRRICKRLSEDTDSPAHMRSNLSLLIALFDRTDVEPIKMEISRLITAVCRVCNSYTGREPKEMERIRIKFFTMHPDVGRPLGFMVSQTKWPVVRSEGWFVLALMARYPEGAQCISDLMADVVVFQPLVELLTGKDLIEAKSPTPSTSASPGSPELTFEGQTPESVQPHAQAAEMARIDRENALVLVSELLKNRGSEMAVMRRTLFEDLLKGGGDLVLSYREAKPNWGQKPVPIESRRRTGLNVQEVAAESCKVLLD